MVSAKQCRLGRTALDTYRSEEEQVEAIKKWWQENGTSTLLSVVVAIALVFGWRTWQDNQKSYTEAGSIAYQDLLESIAELETSSDDIKIATVDYKAETLKEAHSDSGFGHMAAFFKARQAVADNDLPTAEEELRWVLENKPVFEMQMVAELRLAKVLYAQGLLDQAKALIDSGEKGAFKYAFMELKGDFLVIEGDYQAAVDAYTLSQDESKRLGLPVPQTLAVKTIYAKSFL